MNSTPIEWCDFSANPLKFRAPDGRVVWACEKLSDGCKNCYAEDLSNRYGGSRRAGDWNAATMSTLRPFLDEAEFRKMLTAKRIGGLEVSSRRCFVGDMTDIFGEWVPDELLDRLFAVFALRSDVTWQILTTRAERARAYLSADRAVILDRLDAASDDWTHGTCGEVWPLPNVWVGVSVENQRFADERIPLLLQTPAAIRFISAEPLLGELNLAAWLPHAAIYIPAEPSPSGKTQMRCIRCGRITAGMERECKTFAMTPTLDWCIVGGESGAGARPFDLAWARSIVQQCQAAGVACFVKQLGRYPRQDGVYPDSFSKPSSLRDKKGGDPSEWPADLRVREFPAVAEAVR